MRFIKNYQTGEHLWTKPMKLPRTVRGQLAFVNDLHTKMMIDFHDKDHELYNPEYGYGRGAKGIRQGSGCHMASGVYGEERAFQKEGQASILEELVADELPRLRLVYGTEALVGTLLGLRARL